jgi:DUF971 family protein
MSPEAISNESKTGVMAIRWPDGVRQLLGNAFLRARCQCADCKAIRRAASAELAVAPDTRIAQILPVGSYAVQLMFNDGHTRGIYPWAFLRALKDEDFISPT